MMRAFKYRIYPTCTQADILHKQFDLSRRLYNCALEHRITAYKSIKKSISYKIQANELPGIKEQFPEFNIIHSQVLQDVLKRLDNAFQHFFRRVKQSEAPGFPRFKGKDGFNSICYPQSGFKLTGNKVELSKIGKIKIKLHRPVDGKIKTCTIKKCGTQWYLVFTVEQPTIIIQKKTVHNAVGIDLGLCSFGVLSDGNIIDNPRHLKRSEEKLKAVQSKYSKYKGKATKCKLSALHRKVANQRTDFLHKTSCMLVKKYDLIAYEDLNIMNMTNGRFAKSIMDAGWGKFIDMLVYKAESAGTYAIAVNPKDTTKKCSGCGAIIPKEIWQRQHDCPECGLNVHRDYNSSLNILRSGIGLLEKRALPDFLQSHLL